MALNGVERKQKIVLLPGAEAFTGLTKPTDLSQIIVKAGWGGQDKGSHLMELSYFYQVPNGFNTGNFLFREFNGYKDDGGRGFSREQMQAAIDRASTELKIKQRQKYLILHLLVMGQSGFVDAL